MVIRRFWQPLKAGILALVITGLLMLIGGDLLAQADPVEVYFFHRHTCPHCLKQRPLMEAIDAQNPDVTVHTIEVSEQPERWRSFRQGRGITSGAVPRTFVGDMSFIGYSEADGPLEYVPTHDGYIGYRNQIVDAIATQVGHGLQLTETSPAAGGVPWYLGMPLLYLVSLPLLKGWLGAGFGQQAWRYWWGGLAVVAIASVFVGISLTPDATIEAIAQSLPFPLFVTTLALADGFNPCAFTVLIILLSLLTYTHQRRDMVLIGGTFVVTSALMYSLFIMAMVVLGKVLLEQYGALFLTLLGIGVVAAGLINLKDYIWLKRGVSLSLSEAQQRTISHKASGIVRELTHGKSHPLKLAAAIGGTVALAVFVNLVELGCTAILPVVYMTGLLNHCPPQLLCYGGWTLLYGGIYVLPLAMILAGFVYSLKSTRLSENQGRRLKLVAGIFMLFFGLVMIFQPGLLILT